LLRSVGQDYAGLHADLTANPPLVEIRPSAPSEWPALSVRTRVGHQACLVRASASTDQGPGLWFRDKTPPSWAFRWQGHTGTLQADAEAPEGWPFRVVWQ